MNKAILVGRLTKDPELRATPSGLSVCSFSIAIDRRFQKQGEQKQTDFINCVAWRQTAEFVSKYFAKGRMIGVIGSIQTRSWDDNNGVKHYATEVVVDEAYFTESKGGGGTQEGNYQPQSQKNNNIAPSFSNGFDDNDFRPIMSEDDLPF